METLAGANFGGSKFWQIATNLSQSFYQPITVLVASALAAGLEFTEVYFAKCII